MRPGEVEQWSAKVVDRLERGLRVEDDRVEVKRQLPAGDPLDVARRIAGHANQARADRILWLIGAVEDPQPVVIGQAPSEPDAAAWWTSIEAKFDDVAPAPTFAHSSVDGERSVLGIGFDTTRPPYVVKLPNDKVSREVPWREATRVRTANRFDLLRLLAPLSKRPRLSLMGARVYARQDAGGLTEGEDHHVGWQGSLDYYIDCEDPLVLPDHRCGLTFVTRSRRIQLSITPNNGGVGWLSPGSSPPAGRLAARGDGQLLVNGSAAASFRISGMSTLDNMPSVRSTQRAVLEFRVQTAGLDPFTFTDSITVDRNEVTDDQRGITWSASTSRFATSAD